MNQSPEAAYCEMVPRTRYCKGVTDVNKFQQLVKFQQFIELFELLLQRSKQFQLLHPAGHL